jgi:L-fuculose-phosphate aldolase
MTIQQDLVTYYGWLRRYGLNDSHSGNGSVREGRRVWITPTGACADTLTAADLCSCGLDGGFCPGASQDRALHLAVYAANPLAGAVLHSHGPHTVALTMDGRDFVPPDLEGRLYFPRVPVIDIPYQDFFARSPALVAEALKDYPVAVVRGHGVYAWGETLERAYKWTCSLELSAHTALLARMAGTLPPSAG